MAITLFNEDDHEAQANGVFWRGQYLNAYRIGSANMGGFFVANSNQHTALGTAGAGPCQIIVVHKQPGVGALGHYAGTNDPSLILRGVERMVAQLGGPPIDSVLFAAGSDVGGGSIWGQKRYELTIYGGTLRRYPGATVLWPPQDKSWNWGSCVYLPLTGEVALFHLLPGLSGDLRGLADGTQGVTGYAY